MTPLAERVALCRAALDTYFHQQDLWGDAAWYTDLAWIEKGETMWANSLLTLVIDSSPLFSEFNYGERGWAVLEQAIAIAARFGLYHEMGYVWSLLGARP